MPADEMVTDDTECEECDEPTHRLVVVCRVCSEPSSDGQYQQEYFLSRESVISDIESDYPEPGTPTDPELKDKLTSLESEKLAVEQTIKTLNTDIMCENLIMNEEFHQLKAALEDRPVQLKQVYELYLKISHRIQVEQQILALQLEFQIQMHFRHEAAKADEKIHKEIIKNNSFKQTCLTELGQLMLDIKKLSMELDILKEHNSRRQKWEKTKLDTLDKLLSGKAYCKMESFVNGWMKNLSKKVQKLEKNLKTLQDEVKKKEAQVEALENAYSGKLPIDSRTLPYSEREQREILEHGRFLTYRFSDEKPPSCFERLFNAAISCFCIYPVYSSPSMDSLPHLPLRTQYYMLIEQQREDRETQRLEQESQWYKQISQYSDMFKTDLQPPQVSTPQVTASRLGSTELPPYHRLYKVDCYPSLPQRYNSYSSTNKSW